MSPEKIFYMLKDAELRTGELYATIGLSLSISQPALSDFFNELAEEEKLHAREIELTQNIFLSSPDAYLQNPDAERLIAEFLQNVATARGYFNRQHAALQPRDLLNLALDIERHMVETHGRFFVSVHDSQVKALFRNLNLGNQAHIRKLESYLPAS